MGLITLFSGWDNEPRNTAISGGAGTGGGSFGGRGDQVPGGGAEDDSREDSQFCCRQEPFVHDRAWTAAESFVRRFGARVVGTELCGRTIIELPRINHDTEFEGILKELRFGPYRLVYRDSPLGAVPP
jgi:hypothetical protein